MDFMIEMRSHIICFFPKAQGWWFFFVFFCFFEVDILHIANKSNLFLGYIFEIL